MCEFMHALILCIVGYLANSPGLYAIDDKGTSHPPVLITKKPPNVAKCPLGGMIFFG
jgi:hypothetical protein